MVFLSEDGPYRSISSTSPAALWYSVIRLPFGMLLLLFGDNAVSPRWTKELPRGTEALEETTVFPPNSLGVDPQSPLNRSSFFCTNKCVFKEGKQGRDAATYQEKTHTQT